MRERRNKAKLEFLCEGVMPAGGQGVVDLCLFCFNIFNNKKICKFFNKFFFFKSVRESKWQLRQVVAALCFCF